MLSQALPIALLAVAADALPWAGPMPTPAAVLDDAVAHKETLAVMTAPSLLPRDDEYFDPTICAWIGGDYSLPATCSSHSKCVWNTDYNIVGCCTTKGSECGVYTSCVDKNSPRRGGDSPSVYTCRGDDLCYLNSFPNGFFQYGCGKTEWATTVLTSYSGYSGSPKLQIIYTGTDSSSSTVPSSSAAASPSAAAPSSGAAAGSSHASSSAAPAATSAASDDSGSSSRPVGAIAGGTVGGIAALALVGALIFFFLRRRKNNNDDPKSTVTDISGNNNDGKFSHDPALGGAAFGGAGAAATPYTQHSTPAATPYTQQSHPAANQPVMAELDTPKPQEPSIYPPSSVSPVSELDSPKPYNRDSAAWSALAGRQSVPPLEAPQEAVEMP